jgi:hypothetical protein
MVQQTFLELQQSETTVVHAASRIYAAYIARGMVPQGSEQQWIQKAIHEAIQIAYWADQAVQSDDEKRKREFQDV